MDETLIAQMGRERLRDLASALPGPDRSCEGLTGPLYDMVESRALELGISVQYDTAKPAKLSA